MMKRVLIIDDNVYVRDLVHTFLKDAPEIEICGEAITEWKPSKLRRVAEGEGSILTRVRMLLWLASFAALLAAALAVGASSAAAVVGSEPKISLPLISRSIRLSFVYPRRLKVASDLYAPTTYGYREINFGSPAVQRSGFSF